MVPDLQRLPPGESSRPFDLSADHVGLDEYDVATQGLRSHHFTLVDGSWEYIELPFRYVWPAELDLMAELAGMTPARPLGRLEPRALHEREPQARLGLGEAALGSAPMVPEAKLEQADHGLVPKGPGWYVVNARDVQWWGAEGRGAYSQLEGEPEFEQLGLHLVTLAPGDAMAMYHWEADEESFLVLAGEAILIVEGEERPLRAWDFVHCPPETKHVIVGAGDSRCLLVAVGARDKSVGENWGGYTVDEVAARHNASADEATTEPDEAYANVPKRQPTRCGDDWLPS